MLAVDACIQLFLTLSARVRLNGFYNAESTNSEVFCVHSSDDRARTVVLTCRILGQFSAGVTYVVFVGRATIYRLNT